MGNLGVKKTSSGVLFYLFILFSIIVAQGWSDTALEGLLQTPSNGSIIVSWPINFNWNDVNGANRYNIQIDNNALFTSPERDYRPYVSYYNFYGPLAVTTYYWRIRTLFSGGWGTWCKPWSFTIQDPTDVDESESLELPDDYALDQNYPNPFNPSTTISYYLPKASSVTLDIYDILGRKVKTLIDETIKSGRQTSFWDGTNSDGNPVASGIYFYRLKAGKFVEIKKMTLVR